MLEGRKYCIDLMLSEALDFLLRGKAMDDWKSPEELIQLCSADRVVCESVEKDLVFGSLGVEDRRWSVWPVARRHIQRSKVGLMR